MYLFFKIRVIKLTDIYEKYIGKLAKLYINKAKENIKKIGEKNGRVKRENVYHLYYTLYNKNCIISFTERKILSLERIYYALW